MWTLVCLIIDGSSWNLVRTLVKQKKTRTDVILVALPMVLREIRAIVYWNTLKLNSISPKTNWASFMKLMANMLQRKGFYVIKDLDPFSQGHKGLIVENIWLKWALCFELVMYRPVIS